MPSGGRQEVLSEFCLDWFPPPGRGQFRNAPRAGAGARCCFLLHYFNSFAFHCFFM
jgi:hypothetical protein